LNYSERRWKWANEQEAAQSKKHSCGNTFSDDMNYLIGEIQEAAEKFAESDKGKAQAAFRQRYVKEVGEFARTLCPKWKVGGGFNFNSLKLWNLAVSFHPYKGGLSMRGIGEISMFEKLMPEDIEGAKEYILRLAEFGAITGADLCNEKIKFLNGL